MKKLIQLLSLTLLLTACGGSAPYPKALIGKRITFDDFTYIVPEHPYLLTAPMARDGASEKSTNQAFYMIELPNPINTNLSLTWWLFTDPRSEYDFGGTPNELVTMLYNSKLTPKQMIHIANTNKASIESQAEAGFKYVKNDVAYIAGIRCRVFINSHVDPKTHTDGYYKQVNYTCGYYSKGSIKKKLFLLYAGIQVSAHPEISQREYGLTETITRAQADPLVKSLTAQFVKTLTITDMDIEKMKKEGLYFPNKKFKTNEVLRLNYEKTNTAMKADLQFVVIKQLPHWAKAKLPLQAKMPT